MIKFRNINDRKWFIFCELSLAQLVRFLVVEPTHPGLSPRLWHGCSHFSGFIPGFNGAMLSMVVDVPVDSETLVVTS